MTLTLITILLAILLDRLLPDRGSLKIWESYSDWAESIEQRFNAGSRVQGVSAVFLATVPVSAGIFLAWYLLGQISGLLDRVLGGFLPTLGAGADEFDNIIDPLRIDNLLSTLSHERMSSFNATPCYPEGRVLVGARAPS